MAVSRRLSGVFCFLALASFTAACKKHQTAAIPAPPPSAQRVPKGKRAQPTAAPSAHTTATQPASQAPTPVVATPRLGPILSSTEERQYNAGIDQSLSRTQDDLNVLSKRQLTAEQQSSLHEIQELFRQANATRKVDLISARALADKAQVLARDLVKNAK